MVFLWTDHLNTTFVNALSGSRRINKKVTNLALEVADIPHVRLWRKGSTNVLGDVPASLAPWGHPWGCPHPAGDVPGDVPEGSGPKHNVS